MKKKRDLEFSWVLHGQRGKWGRKIVKVNIVERHQKWTRSGPGWLSLQIWSSVDQLRINSGFLHKSSTLPFTQVEAEKAKVGGRQNYVALFWPLLESVGGSARKILRRSTYQLVEKPSRKYICKLPCTSSPVWLSTRMLEEDRLDWVEATYSRWHCDCLASKEVQTWENKWWQRCVQCPVSLLLLCGSWGGWGMGGERRAAVTWVKVSHTATSAARRAGQEIQLVGATKKFPICDLFPLYALFVILLVRTKETTELKYDQTMVCVHCAKQR